VLRLLVVMALTAAPAAWAATPAELALGAQSVHQEHCANAASTEAGLAAEALAQVSGNWLELREAAASADAPYLLYWSGLLAQCLGQDDAARQDLAVFVAALSGDPGYEQMLGDAQRRLRQLGAGEGSGDLRRQVDDLLREHCRRRNRDLEPGAIQKLSNLWKALVDAGEAAPREGEDLLRRGRLASCLGQDEHARTDLLAAAQSGGPRRVREAAREELIKAGTPVGRNGELLTGGRLERRLWLTRRRGEFWLGGSLTTGGARETTRVYSGHNAQDGSFWNGDSVAWYQLTDEAPGISTWTETAPEPGAGGGVALGLRLWNPHLGLGGPAQFGWGFLGSLRAVPGETLSYRGELDTNCTSRDAEGRCESAGETTLRLETSTLESKATGRLVIGQEFSLRLLPDRLVTPTLHFVFPAVDIPLGAVDGWCATGTHSPSAEGFEARLVDDANISEHEAVEATPGSDQITVIAPAPIAGEYGESANPELGSCVVGGPAPAFLTARIGITVEVRPMPWLSIGVRGDLQPLLWGDAVRPPGSQVLFDQQGLEAVALDAMTSEAPRRLPLLAEFRVQAAIGF